MVGQKPRASGGHYSKRARVTSEKHTIGRVFGRANHSILRSGPGFELQIRTPQIHRKIQAFSFREFFVTPNIQTIAKHAAIGTAPWPRSLARTLALDN